MKLGITLWNGVLVYDNATPLTLLTWSPLHIPTKLATVLGTTSPNKFIFNLPNSVPSALTASST